MKKIKLILIALILSVSCYSQKKTTKEIELLIKVSKLQDELIEKNNQIIEYAIIIRRVKQENRELLKAKKDSIL